MQYLLPLESQETGDVHIFVAQSFGGRRAVGDICTQWGRRVTKNPKAGQPMIELGKAMMPTKNFGDVPRPDFVVIGWDDTSPPTRKWMPSTLKEDMNDDIPF